MNLQALGFTLPLAPEHGARVLIAALRLLGGKGSGHFGHAGRPGEVGGSAPHGTLPSGNIDNMLEDMLAPEKTAIVRRRSDYIAEQMGVPPSIINVVNKEPRAFVVGNQNFKEAGHYNPTTGMIEINARNSYDERISVTNGIVAHEVSHAVFHAAQMAQTAEHQEINHLPPDEFNRLFRASGYVRPEMQAEVHERWPVSAMFYRHLGDSYMETEAEQKVHPPGDPNPNASQSRYGMKTSQLEKDDGVSAYSKSYWQPELLKQSGGLQRAIDETLAETTRKQVAPLSWTETPAIPKKSWRDFTKDLHKIAKLPKVNALIGKPEDGHPMSMATVTVGGREGQATYLDDEWNPTSPEEATLAKVLFEDGSSAFYTVSQRRALENPLETEMLHVLEAAIEADNIDVIEAITGRALGSKRSVSSREEDE